MIRCDENMPELTADEATKERERMMWQEYYQPAAAEVTPLGCALRRLCATQLARIANKRAARSQPHINRWNEAQEIAAQVYDATNSDPHGNLSWRDDVELPY